MCMVLWYIDFFFGRTVVYRYVARILEKKILHLIEKECRCFKYKLYTKLVQNYRYSFPVEVSSRYVPLTVVINRHAWRLITSSEPTNHRRVGRPFATLFFRSTCLERFATLSITTYILLILIILAHDFFHKQNTNVGDLILIKSRLQNCITKEHVR
jgi:hypothetical protein